MVRHIVIFKFKGDVAERRATAEKFKSKLDVLPEIIPELIRIETGINCNEKENSDLVLIAEAATLDDVAAYSAHPAHVAAVDSVRSRIESRTCADYLL